MDLARLNTYNTNDDTLTAHAYYSYLFTDRPIYQTTDTIKVWGMVRPRDTDGTIPETVILDLGNGAVTQEVETQDNGCLRRAVHPEFLHHAQLLPLPEDRGRCHPPGAVSGNRGLCQTHLHRLRRSGKAGVSPHRPRRGPGPYGGDHLL